MKSIAMVLALAYIASTAIRAQNPEPVEGRQPPPPVDPSLIDVADVPGLPRVLLIGDSISMGYTLGVREILRDKANVHHPAENCGPSELGLAHLDIWLGQGQWDVIHFNFGLHDLKYLDAKGNYVSPQKGQQVASVAVYRKNLHELVLRLKKTGAKLIFATSTPVPPGTLARVAGDERRYNAAAIDVMREMGIPIDDLGGFVEAKQIQLQPRPESELPPTGQNAVLRPGEIQLPFNVHFTQEGYQQLAALVAAAILRELPPAAAGPARQN